MSKHRGIHIRYEARRAGRTIDRYAMTVNEAASVLFFIETTEGLELKGWTPHSAEEREAVIRALNAMRGRGRTL